MTIDPGTPSPQTGEAGAAIYSPLVLTLYDLWVLKISNSFAWRCPTKTIQLPFFRQFLSQTGKHLDIGPGSGYYLKHGNIPEQTVVTLLDLNNNSLHAAKNRLARSSTLTIEADITQSLPLDGVYDSISLFFLLHCLPGGSENSNSKKLMLFANLKPYLTQKGVVYGTTILGKGVRHNWFGRLLMRFYNSKGIFGNLEDGEEEIRGVLCENFEEVETRVVGCVLLFSASGPKSVEKEA